MTPSEIEAAVHRQLGELTAEVRAIREKQDKFEAMMERSDDKSDESRARTHKRMDDLVDRVGDVENNFAQVQKEITEMKPTVDDVKRWKLVGIGALGMIGIAGIALGVSFADVLKRIAGIILAR